MECSLPKAKKIVKEWLETNGYTNKISAKTVDFTDLARDSVVVVYVHKWKPNPKWGELEKLAKKNGFLIDA